MKYNIILPILPIYAEKILNGEKTYEYRKRLCVKDIKRIYLYATTPIKKIVGEVEVLEKIHIDKDKLWEQTKNESGISYDVFMMYFRDYDMASAYRLGKAKKYKEGIDLQEIGILYHPQSYIYVGDIRRKI